jgi:hypothetical protein
MITFLKEVQLRVNKILKPILKALDNFYYRLYFCLE